MATEPPLGYGDGFPNMSENTWSSDPNFDLGRISGLFQVANSSLSRMYGVYDFHLDRNNPLNFDDLNFDTLNDDSKDPSVYIATWLSVAILFTIIGLIWCACNKCCCCCRRSFKEGQDFEDYEPHDKRYGKPSTKIIIVSIVMTVWLIAYLLVIVFAFASNEHTMGTFDQIEAGLDNAVRDFNNYLMTSMRQMAFTFVDEFNDNLTPKIYQSVADMDCGDGVGPKDCESMREELHGQLKGPLGDTGKDLKNTSTSLNDALMVVQAELNSTKITLDSDFEDIMTKIVTGLYAAFMVLNVIYLIIFVLVLVGTVLVTFGKETSVKVKGHLIIRGAVVLMFLFFIIAVIQFLVMFLFSGLLAEVICPAVRELEEPPPPTTESSRASTGSEKFFQLNYKIPSYDKIMRACKEDESAYSAFNLNQTYNIEDLEKDLLSLFQTVRPPVPPTSKLSKLISKNGSIHQNGKSPEETVNDIKGHVSNYSYFAIEVVQQQVGKCRPAFNAINATITVFCHKVPAPVTAFWWILQFIPVIFFLLIVTALIFERVS